MHTPNIAGNIEMDVCKCPPANLLEGSSSGLQWSPEIPHYLRGEGKT